MPIARSALVDRIGLGIQDLHAAGKLSGDQPLLRIDDREHARGAPFQFDAARGLLHRAGCGAIPSGSRSALYAVWEVGAEAPNLVCPRCAPLGRPAAPPPEPKPQPQAQAQAAEAKPGLGRPQDEQAVDLLFGLLSIVSQFGGVLRERGQEYRRSRAGEALGGRIEKIYAEVNDSERRVLDVLTASLDTVAAALREIDGGLAAERPDDGR